MILHGSNFPVESIYLQFNKPTRAGLMDGLWRESAAAGASLELGSTSFDESSLTLRPLLRTQLPQLNKTTTHKASNHGHRQVHRRRLPRRSGRQRRHSSRSAPPALLRRNCRLRAQLAGYRPREFYLQHSNESRSQHLDTNSANDMSGVDQASMCSMRLLFSDIKLHWHCFRPIN